VTFSALRVGCYALLDQRPRFSDAETSDLNALFENHIVMRGYSGEGLGQLLDLAQFKPPLWYCGLAALFAPFETLRYEPLLATNIVPLGIALWVAWDLGARSRGPRAALLAVLIVAILPGVAGRITLLGVEPWHMALLGLYLRGLLVLREPHATRRQAVALGAIVAAGMLMKWNFVAPILGPALLEGAASLLAGSDGKAWRNRLLLAGAVSAALFAAWFVPLADTAFIFATAATEGGKGSPGWMPPGLALGFFWLQGIGATGVGLVVLATLRVPPHPPTDEGSRPRTRPSIEMLLITSILSLLVVHWLIPHKDLRYLLPVFWATGVLVALRLDLAWVQTRWDRALIRAGILGVVLTTFVVPRVTASGTWGSDFEWFSKKIHPSLRLKIDRSDHGIGRLVDLDHPSGAPPLLVASSLTGSRAGEVLTMLNWEFYSRNEGPVLSLSSFVPITSPEARVALNSATHFISHRELNSAELGLLKQKGFEILREQTIDRVYSEIPPHWSLWKAKKTTQEHQRMGR